MCCSFSLYMRLTCLPTSLTPYLMAGEQLIKETVKTPLMQFLFQHSGKLKPSGDNTRKYVNCTEWKLFSTCRQGGDSANE